MCGFFGDKERMKWNNVEIEKGMTNCVGEKPKIQKEMSSFQRQIIENENKERRRTLCKQTQTT